MSKDKKRDDGVLKDEGIKNSKKIYLIFFIIGLVIFLIGTGIFLKLNKFLMCNDGTLYNNCSELKPYYCDAETGKLIEKASICGCNNVSYVSGDLCISNYQTEPKKINLNYIFDGEVSGMEFTVYKSGYDYISEITREIVYLEEEIPSRTDFKLKNIYEEEQRDLLLPLVVKIFNLAEDRNDAVRIAVSLVQNIPYNFSNKDSSFLGKEINYSRYSYEVLFEHAGICGEKSALLAFLLKEMGYGVSIFYFPEENHEAVGIKCPEKESFRKTGYCFIETTGPSIITDGGIEYVGGITLNSIPEIMIISEGDSIGKGWHEYRDARTLEKIRNGKFVLFRNSRLESLTQKYGLVEEYNLE